MERIRVEEKNKKKEYDVLFTVSDKETGFNYIVYTDDSVDMNGNGMLYFARYENNKLIPISKEEKNKLKKVCRSFQGGVCTNEN